MNLPGNEKGPRGNADQDTTEHHHNTAPASWPSRIFDVLDRLDRNAAQVLALLIGGVR